MDDAARPMSHGKLSHHEVNEKNTERTPAPRTITPLENFHAREERLRAILYALNDAFEEKLAILTTNQIRQAIEQHTK